MRDRNTRDGTDLQAGGRDPNGDRLLSYKQVAALLSCSDRHVWTLAAQGHLPRVRIGPQTVRFRLSDVQKLVLGGVES